MYRVLHDPLQRFVAVWSAVLLCAIATLTLLRPDWAAWLTANRWNAVTVLVVVAAIASSAMLCLLGTCQMRQTEHPHIDKQNKIMVEYQNMFYHA